MHIMFVKPSYICKTQQSLNIDNNLTSYGNNNKQIHKTTLEFNI